MLKRQHQYRQRLQQILHPFRSIIDKIKGLTANPKGAAYIPKAVPTPPPVKQLRLLETDKSLSECLLWQLHEEFYAQSGIAAWEGVPYYPTSNAYIGEVYAKAIIAFLLDYRAHLDPDEPVYIIEMAAGTGCLSFYTIKELLERKTYFESLKDVKICYVVTDFAENNLHYWESLPDFRLYIAQGALDFALFKPESEQCLTLRHSKTQLTAEKIKNPVIAVANYFFDTIRQDYFHVYQGKLQDARLTLYQETDGTEMPLTLEQLRKTEVYRDISPDYYPDARLNALLAYYCEQLTDGSLIFPIGAFRCLMNLQALSNGNLMLISSDKGFTHLGYMEGRRAVPFYPEEGDGFACHGGAFSYSVNYHALARYFRQQAGFSCTTGIHGGDPLHSMIGIIQNGLDIQFNHVAYFWRDYFEKKDTLANHHYRRWLMKSVPSSPEKYEEAYHQSLAMLEESNADPLYFISCITHILTALAHNRVPSLSRLQNLLVRIEKNLYASCHSRKTACHWLREVYVYLNRTEEWARLNREMEEKFGEDEYTCYYQGLLEEDRDGYETAEWFYRKALTINPNLEASQRALTRLHQKPGIMQPAT